VDNFKYHAFIFIIILFALFPSLLASQKITFTYNPPDGTHGVKTEITYTLINFMSNLGSAKTIKESTLDIEKTDSGWAVIESITNIEEYSNEELSADTLVNNLLNKPIKYVINDSGYVEDIRGLQEYMIAQNLASSQELLEVISGYSDSESVYEYYNNEWYKRIGCFVNKSFMIGDEFNITDSFHAGPSAYYVYETTIRIADTVTYDNHACILLQYRYVVNKETAKSVDEDAMAKLLDIPDEERDKFMIKESDLSGFGERTIDPSTLLIYREAETIFDSDICILPSGDIAQFSTGSTYEVDYRYNFGRK
jgi:hypothetical protein